jgi:nucleoside-diphosphate-sugar epimerase
MNEDNHTTTVLVTGASGFIAMHCVLQLLQAGYRVRGTLRSPAREEKLRATFAQHTTAGDRLEFVTADLLSDDGWAAAVAGCRYVLHVASPTANPKDENEAIIPARDGTLRVLQAAANAGVRRVVLTSSIAAIVQGHDSLDRTFTEDDWSNADAPIGAYGKSKTLAERAAWDFVEKLPPEQGMELTSINPSYVLGPLLDDDEPDSAAIVGKLIRREVPGCPRFGFTLVDVRDVASAHLLAMTSPQAAGKRFICYAEFFWMRDIALVLEKHLAPRGYRIPTRPLPNIIVRLFAPFDAEVRRLLPNIGQRVKVSSERLQTTLDWRPRPVEQAITDTADTIIAYKP